MPKHYKPEEIEPKWQAYWEEHGIHRFDPASEKPIYSIDTPPPTVSGSLHIGHVFSYTHTEIQARFWRMRGYNVYYPMGWDDNGLPSERLTEKELDIKATDLSRGEFIDRCLEVTRKYEKEFEELWRRMGMSLDWSLTYSTIEERTRRISQRSFLDLVEKGMIYRQNEPVTWCTECRTAIAQAEMESKPFESIFNDIVFTLDDGTPIVIATTRPELLPACVAVFVHPDDEANRHLIGRKAKPPLFDLWVPILADEQVDREKGTGIVMCCTFGDKTDIDWWKTRGLDMRIVLGDDGHLNELAPGYEGLYSKKARKRMIEAIEAACLLKGQKPITHEVSTHERCGTEVEFLSKYQWFIKVLDYKKELIARADEINWYPPFMKTRYVNWVDGLAWDWCISRQRFFGVPFPVWYCKSCGETLLARAEDLPVDPLTDPAPGPCRCGSTELTGEGDVMDTWATSSLTPNINARWGEQDEKPGLFPMSLRPQAHEIIRTWTFYTIAKSHLHEGTIPWRNVAVSGFITIPSDEAKKKGKGAARGFKAEKISKSKHGHITSPFLMLENYGADGLRYWASNAPLGSDMPLNLEDFKIGRRTLVKLWNSFRFASLHIAEYSPGEAADLETMDRWLLVRLNRTIEKATRSFNGYDLRTARQDVGEFFWKCFCDDYLEIVKDRLYNPDVRGAGARAAAQETLYRTGLAILKMWAPFIPHVTEEIYQGLFRETDDLVSLHRAAWPEPETVEDDEGFAERAGNMMTEMLGAVRQYKGSRSISMREDVACVEVTIHPEARPLMEAVLDDFKAVSRAVEIKFVDGEERWQVVMSLPGTDFEPVAIECDGM